MTNYNKYNALVLQKTLKHYSWLLGVILLTCGDQTTAKTTLVVHHVGKVVESQGICSLKPHLQQRWTPVSDGLQLSPGDWLRTDVRGANAMRVRLQGGGALVLGPGSLVEVIGGERIRLVRGELEVSAPPKHLVGVRFGDSEFETVTGRKNVFRMRDGKKIELESDPNWLQSFKGALTTESMGSLLAMVDGRDVPLTIGYHKVSVDIRDQIARTVIEESFVNHTESTLEGVFYFPLPQDASISGFAMWIGEELIEADVVEKERAREIYETILRERRDPGLLEWSGGNIFKARVFPIFGHSEKRIKITYTQVLPMQGTVYRYRYALQSEMLRQTPLRELAIDVRLHSEIPLKSVNCPSHLARIESTAHSVQIEFAAQEYTPMRDFEVRVEVERGGGEVTVIPHRRGDDGYFLLLLSAPDDGGARERMLVMDGPPLDVILVADTSASMDPGQREAQDRFLATLLGSLGENDRFRLAALDVECNWFENGAAMPASEAHVAKARDYLGSRGSLGWTDLENGFREVLQRAADKSQIIYIGDGIGTTGDADPVAIASALRRLHDGKGTVHAVATGSSYESGILKSLASMGGGSFRVLEGKDASRRAAVALISEILQPGIRDFTIAFDGVRVARVYPESLPNLAAGTQQILLGRYLPDGRDQSGKVTVTGYRDGKAVGFSAPVKLKDAEKGNAFIPRLWARMHLNELLEQGQSPQIKSDIIGLSEEYHIMTPFTSFLILESDEDRERFKVTRRFRMRDGERFFAEGRDAASFELRQKQIRLAGKWRQDLRREMLRELMEMGRSDSVFGHLGSMEIEFNALASGHFISLGASSGSRTYGEPVSGRRFGLAPLGRPQSGFQYLHSGTELGADMQFFDSASIDADFGGGDETSDFFGDEGLESSLDQLEVLADEESLVEFEELVEDRRDNFAARLASPAELFAWRSGRRMQVPGQMQFKRESSKRLMGYGGGGGAMNQPVFKRGAVNAQWMNMIIPALAEPHRSGPAPTWSGAALKLSDDLLRTKTLNALEGGLNIRLERKSLDPKMRDVLTISRADVLYSKAAWVSKVSNEGSQTLLNWANSEGRGVYSPVFGLGRQRQIKDGDLALRGTRFASIYNDHSLSPLSRVYAADHVTLKPKGRDRVVLELDRPGYSHYRQEFEVDSKRKVLVASREFVAGKLTAETLYQDFKHVAGSWWATRIVIRNGEGQATADIGVSVKSLTVSEFDKGFALLLPDADEGILLKTPLPTLREAKQALHEKQDSLESYLVRISHHMSLGQWEKTQHAWDEARRLVEGLPGEAWLSDSLLSKSRRRAEATQRYRQRATDLARDGGLDEYFLATFMQGRAASIMQANERLALLEVLKPVYERQPKRLKRMKAWAMAQARLLMDVGQEDEALQIWKALAKKHRRDSSVQTQCFSTRAEHGELMDALSWMHSLLADPDVWSQDERNHIRSQMSYPLRERSEASVWHAFTLEWVEDGPANQDAFSQYLVSLARLHRVQDLRQTMKTWMEEGVQASAENDQMKQMRLGAAVGVSLGQVRYGHGYRQTYDSRWTPELVRIVRAVYRSKQRHSVAGRIMLHHQFRRSDEGRALILELGRELESAMDSMRVDTVIRIATWLMRDDPPLPDGAWERIAEQMERRWAAESDDVTRAQLGRSLVGLLRSHGGEGRLLAFLHRQLRDGPESRRAYDARLLFQELLGQPWTAETEDQLFDVFDDLAVAPNTVLRTAERLPSLYRLVDAMEDGRYAAAMLALADKEDLSRPRYKAARRRLRREAREGVQSRLTKEALSAGAAMRPWLELEAVSLACRLKQDSDEIVEVCWDLLDASKGALAVSDDSPERERGRELLRRHLRDRCLTTLALVVTREKSNPDFSTPLIQYLDGQIQVHAEANYWKYQKYRLLMALDRPDELEAALRRWNRPEDADNTWRVALGYLMAELNRAEPAVQLFEEIESADELLAQELRVLAAWYMVLGRKEAHHEALIRAFMTEDEYRLQQRLRPIIQPWYNRSEEVPAELSAETFQIFTALFRKSENPSRHVSQLQSFYGYTKDFRLLECLAEGVLGHSPQQVYPLMSRLQYLMNDIRDEAAVDSVIRHLKLVRKRAASEIDHRALDILELQVERRASELSNQVDVHAGAALSAMQRAFLGDWHRGEPRLMANLLAALGNIKIHALQQEQIHQLKLLYALKDQPEQDHLAIAVSLAQTLSTYGLQVEAFDVLEVTLNQFRAAHRGRLNDSIHDLFGRYVTMLNQAEHFARAEKLVLAGRSQVETPSERDWMQQRLFEVYTGAIFKKGSVSLGSGQALYAAEIKLFVEEFASPHKNHRQRLMDLLSSFIRLSHDARLQLEGMRQFAFVDFDVLLKTETDPGFYHSHVGKLADALHDTLGAVFALEFLVDRLEREAEWVHVSSQSGWSQHAYRLGRWRTEFKAPAALEARLLKVVTNELRRDLRTRTPNNRYLYQRHQAFWSEKKAAFGAVADAVWEEDRPSGAAATYIAAYLSRGLDDYDRAIEILYDADQAGNLDDGGKEHLVDTLHHRERFEEALPYSVVLVKRAPHVLKHRVHLMRGLYKTEQSLRLAEALETTDQHFHEAGLWNESTIAQLAQSCLDNRLLEPAVAYYDEVIALHKRRHRNRGIGDGILSGYYTRLSKAHIGLMQTTQAVDAASGAIVSWGRDEDNRHAALNGLQQVLAQAPGLDRYVETVDAQVAESGLENPVLRQALGWVYIQKRKYDRAIRQLRLAVETQPNDRRTHELLLKVYDKSGEVEGGLRQLREWITFSPREVSLYEDLGKRLAKAGREAESERALTSMVEMLANESESHAALAGVRQHQGRWEDAQHHWRQVIRIRSQEPTGYLNLARIQIRQKEWGAARETCRTIIGRKWPDRFGDARREAEQLLRKIPAEAETTAP